LFYLLIELETLGR